MSKRRSQSVSDARAKSASLSPPTYPFAALVGQEEMKLALLLNVIEPAVGGALIMGERGTGKSTAVRALAELLPPLRCVRGCVYNCDPDDAAHLCADCRARLQADGRLPHVRARVPVVELPLNATEDRVSGTISFERALTEGSKAFEPGLLARANRGFLYIDEVNLLEDHLVDLLLDAAATGRNRVEREGISIAHPARFVLVGSGNPEEGELRPQLLDRFGLYVEIKTANDVTERMEVVVRHEAFARDPQTFCAQHEAEQAQLRWRIIRARRMVANVEVAPSLLQRIAELCACLQVDGHRGELTITRAARALAGFAGRKRATDADVRRVAMLALQHRLRRDPLEQTASRARIEQALAETFGTDETNARENRSTRKPSISNHVSPEDDDSAGQRAANRPTRADPDGRASERRSSEQAAPTSAGQISLALRNAQSNPAPRRQTISNRRQRGGRSSMPARRGRYVRAVSQPAEELHVALDATLRMAASRPWPGVASQRALLITKDDLRFKEFRRRAGTLYIFVVDTSGSMALNRIGQAKGALAQLLRRSYVNRDRVALISFRERSAQLLLRPNRSSALARRLLDALPVGGATPLAAGLLRAYELAQQARREGAERIAVLVFTDGRANVPLDGQTAGARTHLRQRIANELEQIGAALNRTGAQTVVVDTRQRFTAGDEGAKLAHALYGQYLPLPATVSESTRREVRSG
jgi:magnesium chelatase subunit D